MSDMEQDPLSILVRQVCANSRYAMISEDFVRSIGEQELHKRRSLKEAVRTTRSKLHQVGVAFQEKPIAYSPWINKLDEFDNSLSDPKTLLFCRQLMEQHASTRERLSILENFFKETLAEIAPVDSIFDFACGLNPLAIPWMPLKENAAYYACDIFEDMTEFLNLFLQHFNNSGKVEVCNLIQMVPSQRVQVAFLLKTLPCLEQLDKDIALRLLEKIQADYLLVSFPAYSLGGHSKGMPRFYEDHFMNLVSGKPWTVKKFVFSTELAFLVQKDMHGNSGS